MSNRSSGLSSDGPTNVNASTRQFTCPNGETNITDIALNSTGTVLYTAASNTVRLWDIRTYVYWIYLNLGEEY